MRRSILILLLFLLVILGLSFAACRKTAEELAKVEAPGAEPTATGAGPTATGAEATVSAAGPTRITDVGLLSTHVWAQPTTMIQVTSTLTIAATTPTAAAADAELIERGKRIFENKNCVKCHGPNAEGISGKGAKLAGTSLTQAQFEEVLRTGDRGRLGNEHLFGHFDISASGIKALYAFLRSLGQ